MCAAKIRVIPVILWDQISAVKGESFNPWRKLGPILPAINVYLARNVDEIILLNVAANKYGTPIDYQSISRFFSSANLPLSYGGGLRNIEQINKLLECGVDKVVLGTVCYKDKNFVSDCVNRNGSQFVVASVDYRYIDGKARCFSFNGKVLEDVSADQHIYELVKLGVGEIILTNIDHEGNMEGFDTSLLETVRSKVQIPIIINGGAGDDLEHFHAGVRAGADALAASSSFLFTELTPRKVARFLSERGFNMRIS